MLTYAPRISDSGIVEYPIEPFARWLDRLVAEAAAERPYMPAYGRKDHKGDDAMPPVALVAYRCGVEKDTLQKWRKRRAGWIDERTIDAVVTNEGSIHIGDLYPEYRNRPVAVRKARRYGRRPKTKVRRR